MVLSRRTNPSVAHRSFYVFPELALNLFRKKTGRVSPEGQELPTVETVIEVTDTTDGENPNVGKTGPPLGRLPPLQPLKVMSTLVVQLCVVPKIFIKIILPRLETTAMRLQLL